MELAGLVRRLSTASFLFEAYIHCFGRFSGQGSGRHTVQSSLLHGTSDGADDAVHVVEDLDVPTSQETRLDLIACERNFHSFWAFHVSTDL